MHKEPWQNYYMNGQPVDAPYVQGTPMPDGQQIGVATIFLWRQNEGGGGQQVLLQTRNENLRLWPGYLDVSAAGHLDFGEQPLEAALREMHEELGLEISADDLAFIGTLPLINSWPTPPEPELHFVYAYKIEKDLQTSFSDQEVTAVDWYNINDVIHAVKDGHLKLAKADSPLFDFSLLAIKKLAI
ncbi:NUDIX domain-containing protein [Candidatus Saccharibacteria bacterium]|nr:NUDIX domain-containing protein [Candidatus Saccharibacteria bacterium]